MRMNIQRQTEFSCANCECLSFERHISNRDAVHSWRINALFFTHLAPFPFWLRIHINYICICLWFNDCMLSNGNVYSMESMQSIYILKTPKSAESQTKFKQNVILIRHASQYVNFKSIFANIRSYLSNLCGCDLWQCIFWNFGLSRARSMLVCYCVSNVFYFCFFFAIFSVYVKMATGGVKGANHSHKTFR